MKTALLTRRTALALSLCLLIILGSIALAFSQLAQLHPVLYAGITYDLILTAPLLLFFLSGRTLPKSVIGLFVTLGLVTAYVVIPTSEQFHLNLLRFLIVPVFELTVVGSVIYYAHKTIVQLKQVPHFTHLDYYTLFQQTAIKLLGNQRTGKVFGSEFALFYYLFRWNRTTPTANEFSYHKTSGSVALVWALVLMTVAETVALHFLLINWSFITTWVLTATSMYGVFFLIAHANAMRYRPHVVTSDGIELKNGLFGTAIIPFSAINKVELSSKDLVDETLNIRHFSLLGKLESHNVVLYLKEPMQMELLYGITKNADVFTLSLDDTVGFKEEIEARLV